MSEPSFFEPPDESVGAQPEAIREVSPRDLALRFGFGAATSVVAGALSLATTPIIGGVMLAFPAILAASLTLIADQEGRSDAREDARGAVLGAVGLAAFAGISVALFGHLPAGLVLAVASAVWAAVALGGYWVLWVARRRSAQAEQRVPRIG